MKKLSLVLFAVACISNAAKANPLLDSIQATLVDHVEVVMQFDDKGNERMSLLDSVLRIGSYKGHSLLHAQLGFSGNTKPEAGETAGWVGGAFFRLDPFFKDKVKVAEHWEFLKALEFGLGYHYDFREKEEYANLTVGLAFDPTPKQ